MQRLNSCTALEFQKDPDDVIIGRMTPEVPGMRSADLGVSSSGAPEGRSFRATWGVQRAEGAVHGGPGLSRWGRVAWARASPSLGGATSGGRRGRMRAPPTVETGEGGFLIFQVARCATESRILFIYAFDGRVFEFVFLSKLLSTVVKIKY